MKFPIVAVAAVLVKDGKVLLVKRGNKKFYGYWALPGGHIDRYERAEKAVRREVKEETGLTLKSPKFLSFYEELFPKMSWHALSLVYTGKFSGKMRKRDGEVTDIGWFSRVEVRKMKLAFEHKKVLKDHFRI